MICLLKLLLVIVTLADSEKIFYIAPEPDEIVCPQYPCTSLSQFAINSSSITSNGSNITLYLLPGHHRLDNEIMVSNAESYIMTNYLQDGGAVTIECSDLGRLSVNLTNFVGINGALHFVGCGGNEISIVDELVIRDTIFEGVLTDSIQH